MKLSKYLLLNNEAWLREKYEIEKIGIRQMSILAGAKTSNSVRQALIKFNIPIRNISDESFSRQDQDLLCDKIREKFGLRCTMRPCREGTGYRIHVPQKMLEIF